MPTLTLIVSSYTPAASVSSRLAWTYKVDAGWITSVLISPILLAIYAYLSELMIAKALSFDPALKLRMPPIRSVDCQQICDTDAAEV